MVTVCASDTSGFGGPIRQKRRRVDMGKTSVNLKFIKKNEQTRTKRGITIALNRGRTGRNQVGLSLTPYFIFSKREQGGTLKDEGLPPSETKQRHKKRRLTRECEE